MFSCNYGSSLKYKAYVKGLLTAKDQKLSCSERWKIGFRINFYRQLSSQHITLYSIKSVVNYFDKFWKRERVYGGHLPADLNHFHFQRSHHSYYTIQLTSFLTAFPCSGKKRAPSVGRMFTGWAHEESYFRVRERSKMSAADCTKYGGQHGTRAARTCDLLTPTVVFDLKGYEVYWSETRISFSEKILLFSWQADI